MGRASSARSRRTLPRESDRLSRKYGGTRTVRKTVPRLRGTDRADCLADNETNYCARCQTGGRLLADRALSRLMHEDWPRTLEEMEELRRR